MSEKNKTMMLAEIGSNYNNELEVAKKYVLAAKEAGANAIKFQTLRKEKLIAPKVSIDGEIEPHPAWNTFANLELPDQWHFHLKHTADSLDIEFISTPFYIEAVELLEQLGVDRYKIASGDITFIPLLEAIGRTGKPVILSTGASTLGDVEKALASLVRSGTSDISLLHCVSSYPPAFESMNLNAMLTLKKAFNLPVGISDHSPGSIVPIAAVAMGAVIVEKHVTFDRSSTGPDHFFAMTLTEFGEMVNDIRLLEKALGNGKKMPSKEEYSLRHRIRRGVYDSETLDPIQGNEGIWLRPEKGVLS